MSIQQLFQNKILINSVLAFLTAQIIKTVIYALSNKTLDFKRMIGDGGMPSAHSATVTALASTAAIECGLDSPVFAVAAITAIIVMHDAMGVRLEAGKHAKAINELMEMLYSNKKTNEKMQELLGHTPLQVGAGLVTGLIIAIIFK